MCDLNGYSFEFDYHYGNSTSNAAGKEMILV